MPLRFLVVTLSWPQTEVAPFRVTIQLPDNVCPALRAQGNWRAKNNAAVSEFTSPVYPCPARDRNPRGIHGLHDVPDRPLPMGLPGRAHPSIVDRWQPNRKRRSCHWVPGLPRRLDREPPPIVGRQLPGYCSSRLVIQKMRPQSPRVRITHPMNSRITCAPFQKVGEARPAKGGDEYHYLVGLVPPMTHREVRGTSLLRAPGRRISHL